MLISKRYLLNLSFILVALFAWTQCVTVWHAADHPFHKSSVYCDVLLAAHAQPAQSATPQPLVITFNSVDFWQPSASFIRISIFTWILFSPRGPPL